MTTKNLGSKINSFDKMANKPGPKPAIKLMDVSKFVFREVELKSPAWKHFLRDQKNGVAKCKIQLRKMNVIRLDLWFFVLSI